MGAAGEKKEWAVGCHHPLKGDIPPPEVSSSGLSRVLIMVSYRLIGTVFSSGRCVCLYVYTSMRRDLDAHHLRVA